MAQRAAIVTTLRNAHKIVASFLDHHLSIGFAHVFLFFDDPGDAAIPVAEQYRDVTVIRHDAALRRRWQAGSCTGRLRVRSARTTWRSQKARLRSAR